MTGADAPPGRGGGPGEPGPTVSEESCISWLQSVLGPCSVVMFARAEVTPGSVGQEAEVLGAGCPSVPCGNTCDLPPHLTKMMTAKVHSEARSTTIQQISMAQTPREEVEPAWEHFPRVIRHRQSHRAQLLPARNAWAPRILREPHRALPWG